MQMLLYFWLFQLHTGSTVKKLGAQMERFARNKYRISGQAVGWLGLANKCLTLLPIFVKAKFLLRRPRALSFP